MGLERWLGRLRALAEVRVQFSAPYSCWVTHATWNSSSRGCYPLFLASAGTCTPIFLHVHAPYPHTYPYQHLHPFPRPQTHTQRGREGEPTDCSIICPTPRSPCPSFLRTLKHNHWACTMWLVPWRSPRAHRSSSPFLSWQFVI